MHEVTEGGSIVTGPPRLGKLGGWWFSVEANSEFPHTSQYVGNLETDVIDNTVARLEATAVPPAPGDG